MRTGMAEDEFASFPIKNFSFWMATVKKNESSDSSFFSLTKSRRRSDGFSDPGGGLSDRLQQQEIKKNSGGFLLCERGRRDQGTSRPRMLPSFPIYPVAVAAWICFSFVVVD
ncbi:hypothetical protein KSP39_PZI000372 [Platanthera zijinensis]|uniref:Uncharacterized protein n=1 Tax=Platanthera zijinensis TaxID=2320716 RepID=A0AAP0C5U6_9ASPA